MPLDSDTALIGDWNSANAGDANNPPGTDSRKQGDDQIRRAKGTIRRHFPGFVGTAAVPKTVNASEDEINTLVGVDPANKVDAFPAGTILLFENNTVPGWTKLTDAAYNNVAMRISTGTLSGTTQGSLDFDVVFSANATDDHVLDVTQIPAHTHGQAGNHDHKMFIRTGPGQALACIEQATGQRTIASDQLMEDKGNHTHASVGNDQGHNHTIDLQVRYRDVCAFQKD